jgi:hypothetical protein
MDERKNFFCKIGKKHLLKDTKCLPCGNMVCKNCVDDLLKGTKEFKCPCCDSEHYIFSLSELPTNTEIEKQIKANVDGITKEIIEALKQKIKNLESIINHLYLFINEFKRHFFY